MFSKIKYFLAGIFMLPSVALADVCPPGQFRSGGCSPARLPISPVSQGFFENIAVPLLISGVVNGIVLAIDFLILGKIHSMNRKFVLYLLSVTAVGAIADLLAIATVGTESLFLFFATAFISIFALNYLAQLIMYKDFKAIERLTICVTLALITNPVWLLLIQQALAS